MHPLQHLYRFLDTPATIVKNDRWYPPPKYKTGSTNSDPTWWPKTRKAWRWNKKQPRKILVPYLDCLSWQSWRSHNYQYIAPKKVFYIQQPFPASGSSISSLDLQIPSYNDNQPTPKPSLFRNHLKHQIKVNKKPTPPPHTSLQPTEGNPPYKVEKSDRNNKDTKS